MQDPHKDNHRESGETRLDMRCPLCESAMLVERHCKRLCENCGYMESCEDLFGPPNFIPPPEEPRPDPGRPDSTKK